jgi:hypothetical protein
LQGLPVYFNPKGGTGLTISGDFGRALNTKVNGVEQTQKPVAIGGSVRLGLPLVTVGVGAAIFDPKITTQANETQYAGTAAVKVFGGGLIPVAVSVQGGRRVPQAGGRPVCHQDGQHPRRRRCGHQHTDAGSVDRTLGRRTGAVEFRVYR